MTEENVYVVKVSQDKEVAQNFCEPSEQQLWEYLLSRNLVTKKDVDFTNREKSRLLKMGYPCQLLALLYNSNIISMDTLIEVYRFFGNHEISKIGQSVDNIELQVPKVRNGKQKEKKTSTRGKKEKTQIEVTHTSVTQKIEKKSTSKKATRVKPSKKYLKEKAERKEVSNQENIESTFSAEVYARQIYDAIEELKNTTQEEVSTLQQPDDNKLQASLSLIQSSNLQILKGISKFQDMLSILHKLDDQLSKVPSNNISTATAITTQPTASSSESTEEGSDRSERLEMIRGKNTISATAALQSLKKGLPLDGYYIADLNLSSNNFDGEVNLSNCVLENFDASSATFSSDVSFEGACFIGKAIFKGTIFAKEAQFKKAVFLDGADYTKTEFAGETRFHSTAFKRFVSYNRAKFNKKVIFSYCQFARGAKFNEVEFLASASFNNVHCEHRFSMNDCKFEDEATFSNAEFSDITDFSKSIFQETAKFIGTIFAKYVSFQSVKFQNDCCMSGATIEGDLLFNYAQFEGLVDMQAISAEHNVNFKEAKLGENALFKIKDAYFGRLFMTIPQLEGRLKSHKDKDYKIAKAEYGLLKNNFREINEYECEDWAYLQEKRAARKDASKVKAFFEWLVLDIPCGYGTKTINIFPTLFVLFLLFAGVFYAFGDQFNLGDTIVESGTTISSPNQLTPQTPPTALSTEDRAVNILDSVQISFCTLTNLSIGDWSPRRGSWINYMMMFESFLGFLLMNVVVVVTFSRKVSR